MVRGGDDDGLVRVEEEIVGDDAAAHADELVVVATTLGLGEGEEKMRGTQESKSK